MNARFVGVAAFLAIVAAHILSALTAKYGEIYMLCAVSYFNRLMAVLGHVGLLPLFLFSGLGLVMCGLIIAGMAILVLTALGLSVILAIIGSSSRPVLICASTIFLALGTVTLGGIILIWANHGIGDISADKLNISPLFLAFPFFFAGLSGCLLTLQMTQPKSS